MYQREVVLYTRSHSLRKWLAYRTLAKAHRLLLRNHRPAQRPRAAR